MTSIRNKNSWCIQTICSAASYMWTPQSDRLPCCLAQRWDKRTVCWHKSHLQQRWLDWRSVALNATRSRWEATPPNILRLPSSQMRGLCCCFSPPPTDGRQSRLLSLRMRRIDQTITLSPVRSGCMSIFKWVLTLRLRGIKCEDKRRNVRTPQHVEGLGIKKHVLQ